MSASATAQRSPSVAGEERLYLLLKGSDVRTSLIEAW